MINKHTPYNNCLPSAFVTGDETEDIIKHYSREEMVVFRAIKLLKTGITTQELCDRLGISPIAAKKMNVQFIHFGKIFLPREPHPHNNSKINDIQFPREQTPLFFRFDSTLENDNQP